MLIASDALLGRKVVDHAGNDVGVVLDVAAPRRQSGFVLVGPARVGSKAQPILRVDLHEVAAFRDGVLRLRPVPGSN